MKTIVFRGLLLMGVAMLLAAGCSRESRKAAHLRQGEARLKAGDYDRAEIEFKNVLRLDPTNRVALRHLGLMTFEQGRLPQAYALLSQAKAANPEDVETRVKLALILLGTGKAKEARAEALQLLARQPTNSEVLLLLVESSLTPEDAKDTRQRLAAIKPVNGGLAGYPLAWGVSQMRQGDLDGAEKSFRQALALDAKSSEGHVAMGSLHLLRKDPTNAESEFKAAAEAAPPRSNHRLRYVDCLLAKGDVAEGKSRLEQTLKQAPDYLPARLKLAQVALAERRFAECEGILRSLLARDPTHLEGMLLMSRLRVACNEPAKAVTELESALKLYPRLPQVHYQLAVVRLIQNDLSGAIKNLNQALSIQPDLPEAVLLMAELNIRRGYPTMAIGALAKLTQQHPESAQAQLLLATAYRAHGNLAEALQVYQSLNRRYPTNPEPFLLSGMILEQQKRNADARKSYEQALTFAPNYLAALEQLVGLDLIETNFSGAKKRVQMQIARNPKSAGPYVLLAKVLAVETNFPAAEAALQKAIECEPDYGPAHAVLARVYVAANKHQAALRKYAEVVARNTNDIGSWLQIAELHGAASNHVAAKGAYESILAVNPKSAVALNNLAWLYLEHLGDPKRAYELAARAHDELPDDPSTSDTFGWVLYRNRDYARALTWIQKSAAKLSTQPEVLFHLGMAHYMMGEEAAARVALQAAVQLSRDGDWRGEAQQRLRILEVDPATADAKTVAELQKLQESVPDDPILLTRLAGISERAGDWKQAVTAYEKALVVNDHLVPAMVKLAQLYGAHLNDPQRAIALARRARSLEPDDPVIAHTLGKLAYDSAQSAGDFQWSFSLLQGSARSLPGEVEVQFDYALAAYAVGQVSNAVAVMRTVLDTKPAPARFEAASTFVEMNRLAEHPVEAEAAAAKVRALLQQQPDYVPALLVSATLQERAGDFAGARDSCERVLKLRPAFTPVNRSLASLYFERLHDAPKAFEHASRAREAFPHDSKVARILGCLAQERGEYGRAVQLLQECAPSFPNDAEVFYNLGMAQYKVKLNKESRASLTKALAMAPNSPLAAKARQLLTELK